MREGGEDMLIVWVGVGGGWFLLLENGCVLLLNGGLSGFPGDGGIADEAEGLGALGARHGGEDVLGHDGGRYGMVCMEDGMLKRGLLKTMVC